MHIGESTERDVEELLAEAGLNCHTSVFGLERILHSIEESGLGPGARRRLASWACHPQFRTFTNSDIAGVVAHEPKTFDSCYRLNPGREISLDHPFFFEAGWYVPVSGADPHRWSSDFSVKAIASEAVQLRLCFRPWPGYMAKLAVTFPGIATNTYAVGREADSEIRLKWPETLYPVSAHFTITPGLQVDRDPRLFGVCLTGKVICETY